MGPEIIQFAAALVLFLAILFGSYWFVYLPSRRQRRSDSDDNGNNRSNRNNGSNGG